MKDLMRRFVFTIVLCGVMVSITAQDKIEGTVQADIVSQYVWRGQDLGDVSLQPTLGLAYKECRSQHGEISDFLTPMTPKNLT